MVAVRRHAWRQAVAILLNCAAPALKCHPVARSGLQVHQLRAPRWPGPGRSASERATIVERETRCLMGSDLTGQWQRRPACIAEGMGGSESKGLILGLQKLQPQTLERVYRAQVAVGYGLHIGADPGARASRTTSRPVRAQGEDSRARDDGARPRRPRDLADTDRQSCLRSLPLRVGRRRSRLPAGEQAV